MVELCRVYVAAWLLLVAVIVVADSAHDKCEADTGGTCNLFSCNVDRHAVCVKDHVWSQGNCLCKAGWCAEDGKCEVRVQRATCSRGNDWNYALVSHGVGCSFTKSAGKDGHSDSYAVTSRPNIASIAFKPSGKPSRRIIGLTINPDDYDDFAHGAYISLDSERRIVGPFSWFSGATYGPSNILNLTKTSSDLQLYKDDQLVGRLRLPSVDAGKTMYAKIFFVDAGSTVDVVNVEDVVDCKLTEWTPWSSCSVTCGSGFMVRSRAIDYPEKGGGKPCAGDFNQSRACSRQHCPVPCVWATWSTWSSCTASCSGGTMKRTRGYLQPPLYGGACSGTKENIKTCNLYPCPREDCVWGKWSEYSSCSASCGGGFRVKSRMVASPARYGGAPCHGESELEELCATQSCPHTQCKWNDWTEWSDCTRTCGGGVRDRKRSINVPCKTAGQPLAGPNAVTEECGLASCDLDVDWTVIGLAFSPSTMQFIRDDQASGGVASATSTAGDIISISVLASSSVRFGLTSSMHDDAAFVHGRYVEITQGIHLFTLAIVGKQFVQYHDGSIVASWDIDSHLSSSTERGFFAKVFLMTPDASATLVEVIRSTTPAELPAASMLTSVQGVNASIAVGVLLDQAESHSVTVISNISVPYEVDAPQAQSPKKTSVEQGLTLSADSQTLVLDAAVPVPYDGPARAPIVEALLVLAISALLCFGSWQTLRLGALRADAMQPLLGSV
eukprot:TRINITY_DN12111_c0_g2_i2.p1 TRINITY_DN12111_c0_g2~~TRINITY_DN12111_c0_g2_i2.p1  ORF type:complete len:727 (+),score=56.61 TRINITY_DN12111_c0_g2_i2:54-2234(+)